MRSAVALALATVGLLILLFWSPSETALRRAADACHARGLQPEPVFNEFTGGLWGVRCVSPGGENVPH